MTDDSTGLTAQVTFERYTPRYAPTYTSTRSGVAAAAALVEELCDVELFNVAVDPTSGDLVVDVTTPHAGEVVAGRLLIARDRSLVLAWLTRSMQWRGTWNGVQVTVRAYTPRTLPW